MRDGTVEHFPVVAEGDCAHRPLEAGESAHARQLGRVPERDESVGAAHGEVLARGVKLDAYAVARVGLREGKLRHATRGYLKLYSKNLENYSICESPEALSSTPCRGKNARVRIPGRWSGKRGRSRCSKISRSPRT